MEGGMNYQALLFDLDGTLIDSAQDLAASVNFLLAQDGLAGHSVAMVANMVGNGIKILVEKAYRQAGKPIEGKALDEKAAAMIAHYEAHLHDKTQLMDGVDDFLVWAKAQGLKQAIITNKPITSAQKLADYFKLDMDLILGGKMGIASKPAPDMLLEAAQRLGVSTQNCLMIGDSENDEWAAHAAQMDFALYQGGYRQKPADEFIAKYRITQFDELKTLLT